MYWDGGASTEYGVNITRAGGYSCTGPYDIPNVKADSYCVYTNNTIGGPYRGFGMSELHTGIEQCIDELANKIQMDKVEIDITGLDRSSIMNYIRSVYRRGFDEIVVRFNDPWTYHHRISQKKKVISIIHTEVNRLIGVELIEQKKLFAIDTAPFSFSQCSLLMAKSTCSMHMTLLKQQPAA